jgi:DNA-binding LacI/PurR family transcriptional regulator
MIGWSDADGMRLAVRHLADLGHRSIAGLFCYGAEPHPAPPKVIGFLDACRERGIEGRPIWSGEDGYALRNDLQFANGYAAASAFVRDGCDCTAMVARNDFIAMGALRALREAGLAAPRDVSLVGYTDSMLATCAIPPLTSVRTPFAEAGAMAIEHLVQAVNGDRADREGVMLPVSLTVRASTGPPLRREKRRLHAARPYDDRKEEPRHAHAHRKSAQDGLPETTS